MYCNKKGKYFYSGIEALNKDKSSPLFKLMYKKFKFLKKTDFCFEVKDGYKVIVNLLEFTCFPCFVWNEHTHQLYSYSLDYDQKDKMCDKKTFEGIYSQQEFIKLIKKWLRHATL